MQRMCQNCQKRPATTKVFGYDVCPECEAQAYTRPVRPR